MRLTPRLPPNSSSWPAWCAGCAWTGSEPNQRTGAGEVRFQTVLSLLSKHATDHCRPSILDTNRRSGPVARQIVLLSMARSRDASSSRAAALRASARNCSR
jgi:hypothetical protein